MRTWRAKKGAMCDFKHPPRVRMRRNIFRVLEISAIIEHDMLPGGILLLRSSAGRRACTGTERVRRRSHPHAMFDNAYLAREEGRYVTFNTLHMRPYDKSIAHVGSIRN
jgi:hypothetical protein